MPKNVEVKARIGNWESAVNVARTLSRTDGEESEQHDLFYAVPDGRLKLRTSSTTGAELILYFRPDAEGPKMSEFLVAPLEDPGAMRTILDRLFAVAGEVRKKRLLFLYEGTRIHLDRVEGLGEFLEFEVQCGSFASVSEANEHAGWLMGRFGVREEDLVRGAYVDLLQRGSGARREV